jgi:peptidoglycan/xylan/chitin deacetylase (PgdA/CDA1 family)
MNRANYPLIFFIGIAAIIVSVFVFIISPVYALIPLVLFVIISILSPFFPGLQMFLPSVMRGVSGTRGVALTFDDGPDPASTPLIIEMLKKHGIKAHFFIVGRKAAAHPELIRLILDNGHTLGNHTMNHDTLIMLKTESRLNKEISSCQDVLKGFGITAYTFRPPAGIVNPKLGPVLYRLGLYCVMFSIRGYDFGNRRIGNIGRNILNNIKDSCIIMLHDRAPSGGATVSELISQMEEAITGIRKKGLDFLPLEKLIGRKVMEGLWQK